MCHKFIEQYIALYQEWGCHFFSLQKYYRVLYYMPQYSQCVLSHVLFEISTLGRGSFLNLLTIFIIFLYFRILYTLPNNQVLAPIPNCQVIIIYRNFPQVRNMEISFLNSSRSFAMASLKTGVLSILALTIILSSFIWCTVLRLMIFILLLINW